MTKYFNIGSAWNAVKFSTGVSETSGALAKLVGKGLSNTVVFGATEVAPRAFKTFIKQSHARVDTELKRPDLTVERRAELEAVRDKLASTKARFCDSDRGQ